jgi:hypothetical protein
MFFEAENPLDAAKQAWATLDDATNYNSGASILFVSDEYGEERYVFDMEYEVEIINEIEEPEVPSGGPD